MANKKDPLEWKEEEEEQKVWNDFPDDNVPFERKEFNPILTPWVNKIYTAKLLCLPRPVKTRVGDGFVVDLELEDGKEVSLFANVSFRRSLDRSRKEKGYTEEETVGKEIIFQKIKGLYKGEETHFLSAQFK